MSYETLLVCANAASVLMKYRLFTPIFLYAGNDDTEYSLHARATDSLVKKPYSQMTYLIPWPLR